MRKWATCFTRKVVTTGRRAACRRAWRAGCGAVARLTEYLGEEAEPDEVEPEETAGTETGAGDGVAVEAPGVVVVAFGGAGVFGSAGTGAGVVATGGTGAGGFGTVGGG